MATVHEILDFQVKFLKEIERPVESETGFYDFAAVEQFQVSLRLGYNKISVTNAVHICIILNNFLSPQNVIYTIGETFFNYTEHFKLYSAFCSSHSRVVELLQSGRLVTIFVAVGMDYFLKQDLFIAYIFIHQ